MTDRTPYDFPKMNPAQHRVDHRYLTRESWVRATLSECVVLEWSQGGRARVRWANNPNQTYWIDKDDLPEVVEDLGRVDRITIRSKA